MKTNLDLQFKTDQNLEMGGVWFDVTDKASFLIRRFGGLNSQRVKQAMALEYKPFARQVELGTMSADQERRILVKVFVDASLVDWRGVEIDGKEATYSKESAINLLMGLPELFDTLIKYASGADSYKENLGNS